MGALERHMLNILSHDSSLSLKLPEHEEQTLIFWLPPSEYNLVITHTPILR
jgi:hypothetical protein